MVMPKPGYGHDVSRDYAMSSVIRCACTTCLVNCNGYCNMPSLIQINAGGVCETAAKYSNSKSGKRQA